MIVVRSEGLATRAAHLFLWKVGRALLAISVTLRNFEVTPLVQFLLRLRAPVVRRVQVLEFSRSASPRLV